MSKTEKLDPKIAALHALTRQHAVWVIDIKTGKPVLIKAVRFNPIYHEMVDGHGTIGVMNGKGAALAKLSPPFEAVKPRKVKEPVVPGAAGNASENDVNVAQAEAEAEKAKAEAEKSKADAEIAKADTAKAVAEAEKAKAEAEKSKADAEKAKADADKKPADSKDKDKADAAEAAKKN